MRTFNMFNKFEKTVNYTLTPCQLGLAILDNNMKRELFYAQLTTQWKWLNKQ